MAAIACDAYGTVLGLWFGKFKCHSVLEAEAKAILMACKVAPSFFTAKMIIESGRTCLADAVLGFASCTWNVLTLVKDITMFRRKFWCLFKGRTMTS